MPDQSGDPLGISSFYTCAWCSAEIQNRGELPESSPRPNFGICSACFEREISILKGTRIREAEKASERGK
jgi:hypothetical protein